jgi:ABC-type polysaccharide/polyol phosphate export permease
MMSQVRTRPKPPHAEYFPMPKGSGGPRLWLARIGEDRRQLARFWPVVMNMVVQELRVRYQRSVLGFLWTLLNPILMMTTMTVVFSQVLGETTEGYAIYLFSGMVPWTFFAGCIGECSSCIIANEGLIRKIYLPKLIFPLARVLINLTTFVLSMCALFVILGPLGARLSWPMLLLPVATILLAMFALGLGLLLATVNTFYRDCAHFITVFIQAWYFLTPIIYKASRFSEPIQARFWLNPAYPFIELFHLIIQGDAHSQGQAVWPTLTTFLVAAGIATVSLGIGYVAFKSNEDKLVFRL